MSRSVAILETFARGFVAILENDGFPQIVYSSAMLSEWLRSQMDERGVSQAELSRALTERLGRSVDRAAINKMRSGARKISADEMVAITQILGAEPPAGLVGTTSPTVRTVTVAAYVQAGLWAETWEWNEDQQYQVAIPLDQTLEGFKLYAAETRGPSMNRRWPEGTIVVFTAVEETQEIPIPGKRYIVERRRVGGEAEHTVKKLVQDAEGKLWLMPESDDPRFQSPISVEDGTGDGDEVAIIGRVRYAVSRE